MTRRGPAPGGAVNGASTVPETRAPIGLGASPDAQPDAQHDMPDAPVIAPDALVVPRDALVVLIGPAGSGKTTLAEASFPRFSILSSDDFRARLGRDAADQTVTGAAFAALHRALEQRMAAGDLTVVDATSLTPTARRTLLRAAGRHQRPVIALVLDLPAAVVLARNAGRTKRVVPETAVRRHLAMLARTSDQTLRREGFSQVRRLRSTDEVAALRVTIA
ncbi:MAG: AAA family ATPase [Chloroflexota bacterium]